MDVFLSTNGGGIGRAVRTKNGNWSVEFLLTGQVVSCLAADPLKAGVVYAGTRANGVLRSSDHGQTWSSSGLAGHNVKSISASRVERGTLFAGTKPAMLFVSRDGGESWAELGSFRHIASRRFWFSPAEAPFSAYVQGIALSPSQPDVIVAGIEVGAVVRSTDGGKTWTDHRPGALRDCHSITFHAANGDRIYEAGGSGAGVAISRDAGDTWTQPKAGLDRHYGWACAADPEQPDIAYVSTSPDPFKAHSGNNAQAHIFRSIDGGAWQKLEGGLPQPLNSMPYALLTSPAEPGHLYAGLSNGDVWHSADHGDTWRQLPFNLKNIERMLIML